MLAGPRRRYASVSSARIRGWGLALLLPLVASLPVIGRAQPINRAGLVIQNGDGRLQATCVAFSEPSISGLELLQRADVDLILQPAGGNATVCSIDGEGCRFPEERCFCRCQGGDSCRYWTYWHLRDDTWQFSTVGATASRVEPGAVEGWAWGESSVETGRPPPATSFEQICPAAAPVAPAAEAPSMLNESTAAPSNAAATSSARAPSVAPDVPVASPRSSAGRYLLFAGTLAGLLIAILVASRARR